MLRGISDGAVHLAEGANDRFQNAVAQRVAPARSSTSQPKPKPAAKAKPDPVPEPTPEPEDTRSAMQRLIDKFR